MKQISITRPNQKAWVVFSGQTDLQYLRILKQGFRHCFVVINDGNCWVSLDPMSHYTEVIVHHLSPDFDLPSWLEGRGHKVVRADINNGVIRPAPFGVFSCVEAVKRVLGIHARGVLTPWQLYRYLKKQSEHSFDKQKEKLNGKFSITA